MGTDIDKLVQERDQARAQYEDLMALKNQVDDELSRLTAENARLREDADRLDWLDKQNTEHKYPRVDGDGPGIWYFDYHDLPEFNELRAGSVREVIDAARAQAGEGGEEV